MSEDIVDSWEDLEDNGEFDKQLKNLVPTRSLSKESQKQCDGLATAMLKPLEDSGGQTQPSKPCVRILKREPNASVHNNPVLSTRATPSKPIRTLEEREAAYAEARLRILGSAESPQESNLNNGETSSDSSGSAAVGGNSSDSSNPPVQPRNTSKDSSGSSR